MSGVLNIHERLILYYGFRATVTPSGPSTVLPDEPLQTHDVWASE